MRKNTLFPSFLCFLLFSVCQVSAQVVPAKFHGPSAKITAESENTIVTTTLPVNVLCAGSTVPVSFTITGNYEPSNIFSVQLSDASGNFSSFIEIGSLASQANGTINTVIPFTTSQGSGYRIRVVSSSPSTVGSDNGSNVGILGVAPIALADNYCTYSNPVFLGQDIYTIFQTAPPNSWTGNGIITNANFNGFTTTRNYYFNPVIAGAGTHTISQINVNGCTNSKQVKVNVPPVLNVLTAPSPCAPGTVDLTVLIDVSNSVIPAGSTTEYIFNNAAVPNPAAVNVSGNYLIRVTAPNGCIAVKTVPVVIRPQTPINLANVYCTSEAAVFLGQDFYSVFTYPLPDSAWTGPGIFTTTTSDLFGLNFTRNYFFSPTQAGVGTHTIKAKATWEYCSNLKSVTVNASPVLNVLTAPTPCAPGTVDLTLLINTETSIIPSGSTIEYFLNDVVVANPNAVNVNGNYVIRVTTPNGCSAEQTVPVYIRPQTLITLASTYCTSAAPVFLGQDSYSIFTYPLPDSAWTGPGIYTTTFSSDVFGLMLTRNYFFSPTQAGIGTHTIKAKATWEYCSNSKSVTVNASPVLNVLSAPSPCAPATVDLTSLIDQENSFIPSEATVEYFLNNVAVPNPSAINQSGNYTIKVTTVNGCTTEKSVDVFIRPQPAILLADTYCSNSGAVFLGYELITVSAFSSVFPPATLWTGPGVTVNYVLINTNIFTFTSEYIVNYIFNPAIGGTGPRTITANGFYGCTNTKVVTVSAAPVLNVLSAPSPCGGTVDLTSLIDQENSVIPSDATIEYLLNGVAVSDPAAISVNGNYTIRVTTPNGCSMERNVPVTIRSLPVIQLADTYCSNAVPIVLSQETFPLGTFPAILWSGPGIIVEDLPNIFLFNVTRTYRFYPSIGGTGERTITRLSPNGCSTSKQITITGVPVFNCIGDIRVNNDAGQCGAIVSFNAPVVSGGCGNVSVVQTAGPASGSLFPVGITLISFTASDASGNNTSCSFTVTVTDSEKPMLDCGGIIHVINDEGKCGAMITVSSPVASDNCPGILTVNGTRSDGQPLGAIFPVGSTSVTWYVTDASGNTGSCVQEIVVTDTEKPAVQNCPSDIHMTTGIQNASCSRSVSWTPPTATDNCGSVTVSSSHQPGDIFNTGITKVTYTFIDSHGNTSTCSFDVEVKDDTKPVVVCPADQFFCYNTTGMYAPPRLNASDNCGISSISYVITGVTTRSGIGNDASGAFLPGTNMVKWTVTDGNGNTSTCVMNVMVNPPMTVAIPDVYAVSPGGQPNTIYIGYGSPSVQLNANAGGGTPGYTYSWSTGAVSPSISVSPSTPGSYVYTVIITDSKGCSVTTNKTIAVMDSRCGNKNEKVIICHNGNELCVSSSAVPAHLQHGDALGACSSNGLMVRTQQKAAAEPVVQSLKIDIAPNPSSTEYKMFIQSKSDQSVTVVISDNLGRNVYQRTRVSANSSLVFGKNFSPGSYFVVVQQGKEIQTFRLIKIGN